MSDFNLTSFLSGSNDEPEQPQENNPAPVETDAGSGNDFDLTKFVAANPQPKPSAKDPDYGILDRQRDTVIAKTGEDIGKGEALARNLIPFVGDEGKTSRGAELIQLQKLYDGSALKDIEQRRKNGIRGDEEAGERKKRKMFLDSINQSSAMGNSGFGAALAQIQHAKAQEKKTDEETYFDQIENVAKNAGIDRDTLAKIRESSTTVDEFANKLRGVAEGELKAYATRKKEAQQRLEENAPGTFDKIVNGLITNTGYQGKYIIGGMSAGIGLAGVALQSAEQRSMDLMTKTYDVDSKGNLIVIHNDDSEGAAAVKGALGGAAEVAVEQFLEKGIGLAFKGLKMVPGVGKVVGAVGDGVSNAAGKVFGGIGAKLSKKPVGKWLVGAAENFGKYAKYTGVNGIPMEMLEEHVQDFADDVFGFNTKDRDYTSFRNETADWWHNKFWNAEHNKDLFLGLVGTMALQGAYAGAKAHHDIQKWRQNPAGFLKTMIDEKTVDSLSDTELAHLYNFVASPGFTKDKVDRFLRHIKNRTEMANALMELKEANTPFFETDKKAVDEALTSGSVKSQFVPPTTDVSGGKKVDWQPFVWKDGTKTERVFDENTGIAIDKLGGNKLCVTNRDGLRIVVDGETSGDAFGRAMAVADKMSIHNQLLDAKRPAKVAYIKKRIAETAQNGKFIVLKNAADLDKKFPNLKNSADYSPDNPALTLLDGRVVLVTDNMRSATEVNRMILHEAAIHSGLNKKFTTAEKRKFLENVKDPEIERYKANIDARREARGQAPIDWNSDQYIEEAFAHVWDRRRANPLLSQKVNHLVRDIGRALHLPVSYNRDDIEVMVDTLQRDLRKQSDNAPQMSEFDTTNAADSIPYNEAQRDFSGDVADISQPAGSTEGGIMARNMQRNDRIAAGHPYLWQYAMRRFNGDEDAAADYVSERLEDEGKRGVSGEMDHAHHALLVAEKMENGEDLAPEDIEILDEHGFTGPVLYREYGYRKQKNGSWKLVGAKENAAHPELAPKVEPPKPSFPAKAVQPKFTKSNTQQKAEQKKAEHEKRFVDSLKTQGGSIQRLPATSIKTGDGRIVQFKEDADPKTGIVPGNELEGEYDERTAGLPVVMHFEDGHYETVTGRHRIHLAQQQGIDINVMVLEHGEDGKPGTVSIAEAEAIDAKANIKDGKGTMKDYIKFFKHANMTREQAEKEGLLGKKTQGRKAFALYHDATPELSSAVDFDGTSENDERTITPEQAGIIAMNAPKDGHKLNGAVQRSMRDYVIAHPKANGDRLARLTQAKQHQLIQAEKQGQLKPNNDGQMFLFEDMAADIAATDKLDEIENYKEKRAAEYRKLANRIRDAKNSKTVIGGKSMGSILQISKEAAKDLDLLDKNGKVTADKKRLEEAAQLALGKAFLWTRMELPAALQDELERDLKLGKYAAQQDLPVQPQAEKPAKEEPKVEPPRENITGKAESKPKPKPKVENANQESANAKPVSGNAKPENANAKPTPQQTIDAFSAATGIPVTMIGANGEVTADSHAAAETAFRPSKSEDGIQAVDLGDATAEFTDLANQMWFSREFEVEAESDVMPRPGTREQSDSTSLVPAAVPLPRNPAVTDKTAQIISVPADAVKREILNYKNGDRVVRSDSISNVLHDLGKLFKMRYAGRSRYAAYEVKIGNVVFRLSDHNASGSNFKANEPNADKYISVYIEGATYPNKATPIAYTEIRYPSEIFAANPRTVVDSIVNGVSGMLETGDFQVDPNVGKKIEYTPQPSNGEVRWFARELEDHTDEEKQAHNLMVGVKMVNLFASKGYKDFSQFAQTFAKLAPDAYRAAHDYIPGMWLTARIMGAKIDSVDEKTALEALKSVDAAMSAAKPAQDAPNSAATASAETTQATTPPKHGTRGETISAAADELVGVIERGEKFNRQVLEQIVGRHLGGSVAEGTFEMKEATDILELAINRYMKNKGSLFSPSANMSADQAVSVINRIRHILAIIPTATTRSAKQDKMQQFSTPPHEAFMAAWVANVTDKDVSLEPSAGIGGLAVFSNIVGADVILNELDKDGRAKILEQLGIAPKVYNFNAEDLWTMFYPIVGKGEVKRPTVVVMNPPFSNSQRTDKKDTIGVGGKHIEEALQMLAPGGRLVAIVGHGMAHDAESPKVRAWWKKIGSKYTVRADVTVNGNEYAKYGTTYDNNLIVIDKVAPDNTKTPVFGKIESIDELPAMLEGVRNDRPVAKRDQNAQSHAGEQGGIGGSSSNGGTPVTQKPANTGSRVGNSGPGSSGIRERPVSGLGRPKPTPDAGNSKTPDAGDRRSGMAGKSGREGSDKPADGRGITSASVQSQDATVIDAGGVKGEVNTDVREVGNGTFAEYRPSKLRVPCAKPHPTALVESTAMASVMPPNPTYRPILPISAVKSGQPSEAQIEQIVYAGQAHEQFLSNGDRRGYFIGDGTGLGKGTEISGVICDNYNHGRKKAVWVSKNPNLYTDAQRDLKTFGLESEAFEFDPKKKGALTRSHGVAFMSYNGLAYDVVFDTDGNVLSKKKDKLNRFQHLVNWLGKDFDGVIVFDECHKAGNAVTTKGKRGFKKPSATGRAVVALQRALPKARILYVSATGATEVSNLSYAIRLGLWGEGTAFRDREQFIEKVSSGGLSVMEIVARDMKSMGVYAARTLSYEGIVNRKLEHKLTESQTRKYDEFADAWQLVADNVKEALVSSGGAKNSQAVAAAMSAFWGGQQRFFNQVLTAMQMPSVIADAKKQLEKGNSVVFQLVNTNEATQEKAIKAQQAAGEEVNPEELDLSPRDILIGFVEHSFPTTKYVEQTNSEGETEWVILTDADGKPVEDPIALEAKDELLTKLRMMKLDNNPLELLLEEFGVENVAEITGRSRRRQPVRNADGEIEIQLVRRSPRTREAEIDEFNSGKRRVLVFSDAGGTGKSFHADRRFQNQQKRVHYLVQAGWRADSALQGFGRTHRSNEKQPPEYVLCSTDIRGHQRFISTVARRLAQLGSLTAGDRTSAGSGVFSEEDNLENQYASGAVKQLFNEMYLDDYGRFSIVCKQLGFMKLKMDKKTGEMLEINTLLDENRQLDVDKIPDVPTFLNRILNCRVSIQNQLFDQFAEKMRDSIESAKEAGKYDPGLEKLQGDSIEETNRTEIWNSGEGTGSTDIVEVAVGKKTKKPALSFVLRRMMASAQGRDYYFARNLTSGKIFGFAELAQTKTDERGIIHERVICYSPDGTTAKYNKDSIRFDGERANYERILDSEAEDLWTEAQAKLPEMDVAKRYFVHGTLLPIWDRLGVPNPRIFRIAPTGQNGSFLGMEIKPENVNDVLRRFGKTPQSVELTPAMVMNRILQENKAVPLQHEGWEIRRSKVNGDFRIELKGPESMKELQKLEAEGVGTIERIAFTPRFFIPRTEEGVAAFLEKYPAIPEDGGIANAEGSGPNYMAMSDRERREHFSAKLDAYVKAFNGAGGIANAHDDLQNVIAAMSTQELFKQLADFQQYDKHTDNDPIHLMRMTISKELNSRGSLTDKDKAEYSLWYSRDLEDDEGFSAIAIHEVNAWRAARGLPEIVNKQKTTVDRIVKAGKYMASNKDEMDRFIKVSSQTPHGWTAVETNAVQQRRIDLERDFDEKTELINQAEADGNKEQAQKIREARDQVQQMIDTLDRANRFAAREWGLTGLARRFMLNRNGTFAKFTGDIRSDIGRKLTPEEETGAKILWDAYREAQGKLDEATVRKTSELLKDILRKHLKRENEGHKLGNGRTLKEIESEYAAAIDHLIVHANRAGGFLMNLPDGRRWVDAIRRYHMAAALETGRKLSVDDMLDLIKGDLSSAGIVADDHDIMQIITGHGNTYEADNSELEKAMREQRALMNEYQKWEDMMDEGHLPDKTGLIRDEPTQALREAQKITRDLMRDFMQKHPELMMQDASRRLKTVQDSLMKRWKNEIEDLQKAIDSGEKIMRSKGIVQYTPEMEAKKRELDAKRKEYHEMFPAEPLTHAQKLDRYIKVLKRNLGELEAKRTALENAKTDAERAAILGKRKGEKFAESEVAALKDRIAEVKEDIQDLHDLHFPAGTYEEFRAMVERRKNALARNLERIEAKLNARDFGPTKHEPSELAKRVAADPDVIEATRLRNAASKRLMQERERFKRSVLPYNAGRALDWFDSLMAAPRVFRTMLDLSATLTQGAALFTSHPVLGYEALANSIRAFGSEENTDTLMAALMADPDFTEFIEMGGHVYNVSNLDEKGLPEEFRGIAQKLVTIRGKQYGLDDIPGVKGSERSFGVFINCINLSVYKAMKASGGWGPTGPSEAQKKDIALSLNVASGRGYENKGGHGAWDKIMSAALWAPRFAISGFKMAVGWNIIAPQFRGNITERTYADRMVSSKQAAKEYARQIASMAAWTLLATLLLGRKDPEWLEEVLNPLSSNFLNVRVGNTNLNFFGPIKQWWVFMARFITGRSVGRDGVTRNMDRGQAAMRFIRGKLSPLAGLVVDLTDGKTFIGEKLVFDRSASGNEKNGWWHIAQSLGVPLSSNDIYEAFKENSLANALMLTPFIVAGAGKSTYQLDEYARTVNPYKALAKEYKAAQKEGRWSDIKQMRAEHPVLAHAAQIDDRLKRVALTKKQIAALEKVGEKPSDTLLKRYDLEQQQVAELIKKFK